MPVDMPGERIYWSSHHKALVLAEGARIAAEEPHLPLIKLISRAQRVLPIEWRRHWANYGKVASNAWFHDHIAEEVAKLQGIDIHAIGSEIAKETPGQENTDEPDLGRKDRETKPEVVSTIALIQQVVETLLEHNAKMSEYIGQIAEDRRVSIQDRSSMAIYMGRIAKIESRFDSLESCLKELAQGIKGFMDRGFTSTMILYPTGVQPEIAEIRRSIASAPIAAPVSSAAISAPAEIAKPIKKKLLILDVPGGHQENGILKGLEGKLFQVEFKKISNGALIVPDFSAWDHVICTKWSRLEWITMAKDRCMGDKLLVTSGNPDKIVPQILQAICPD